MEHVHSETTVKTESEAEREPKHVFVEIGTHGLAASWLGEGAVRPDDLYIGVDIYRKDLETSKQLTESYRQMNENRIFVQADARHMPVKSGCADEVYLGNVLGDPSIGGMQKYRFIEEARRMVAPGGRVVIKENNTPADLEMVRHLLKRSGLSIESYIDSHSPGWNDALRPYHRADAERERIPFRETSYIIFAVPEPAL